MEQQKYSYEDKMCKLSSLNGNSSNIQANMNMLIINGFPTLLNNLDNLNINKEDMLILIQKYKDIHTEFKEIINKMYSNLIK
jgi:hypothetical protein